MQLASWLYDIKLFAQNDCYLQTFIDTVETFWEDISKRFELIKCAKLSAKWGKLTSLSTLGNQIDELNNGETCFRIQSPAVN